MNYTPFSETNSAGFGHKSAVDNQESEINNIDEEDLRHAREEMFEYYKKNRNLNYYYYMEDDPGWQKDIEELTREFFEILNESKEKKLAQQEEEKLEETASIQISKNNAIASVKPKNRKLTENFAFRKTSDNLLTKEKKSSRNNFEKDCLDLDDLVQAELPTEYNMVKHEELMMNLGDDLINTRNIMMSGAFLREKRSDYLMKNDDFNLLLCLMRKKKESVYEKSPYYVDYHIKMDDVYTNEKDEALGMDGSREIDIEGFVKKYIDNEANN